MKERRLSQRKMGRILQNAKATLNLLGIKEPALRKHIAILIYSIKSLKKTDIWYPACKEDNLAIGQIEFLERTICAELYRIWKNNLSVLKDCKITINAETKKKMGWYDSIEIHDTTKYPDFVLHKSQDNKEQDKQFLVCEVKKGELDKNGVENDFEKFLILMNEESFQAPFAYCVHIQIGGTNHNVKEIISKSFFESRLSMLNLTDNDTINNNHILLNPKRFSDRIICIHYNDDNNMAINTLSQLWTTTNNNNTL